MVTPLTVVPVSVTLDGNADHVALPLPSFLNTSLALAPLTCVKASIAACAVL